MAAIWGREFSEAVAPVCSDAMGQDGWETWTEAGIGPLAPSTLETPTEGEVAALTEAARRVLDVPEIAPAMIEEAARATLHHTRAD